MEKNEEDKVWVTITRTVNLGNYENIKIDVGMSQTLKPKEDPYKLIRSVVDDLTTLLIQKENSYTDTKKAIKEISRKHRRSNDDDDDY